MVKEILNLFFVVDKNYIIPFTATLTSVLENNKTLKIEIFVIHEFEQDDLLDKSSEFFKKKYNLEINFIKIEDKWFEKFYISEHISKTTYFKFLIAEMLPEEIEHGLYLDCDIIVTGSLRKLIDFDFRSLDGNSEVSLYAVPDPKAGREVQRISSIGVEINNYFNAGVMLLNLKKLRAEAAFNKMLLIAEKYNTKLTYWDQDLFNILFKDDHQFLEKTYNMNATVKHESLPIVIHYMGISKPWHFIDNGPYKNLYYKYIELTPFNGLNREKITIKKVARKYVRLFKLKISKI